MKVTELGITIFAKIVGWPFIRNINSPITVNPFVREMKESDEHWRNARLPILNK